MGIRDDHGSDRGVLYRVVVDGKRVFYEWHKDAVWQDARVDLKAFAGKKVSLELGVYSLGEHYALWGAPRIVDNRQGDADHVVCDLTDLVAEAGKYVELQASIPAKDLPEACRREQEQAGGELVAVRPSPQQIAWQELEFIGFVHFTINTFTDREWGDGKEDETLFNPTALDARQWVRVFKEAGMKLLILTAKHHDGFCLWPSKYTEHSVKRSPWRGGKGDVVREVADACREGGIKFGFYLSPWDRNQPSYGDSPVYNEYFKNQLRELLTSYGEVTEVWFDGACGEGPNGKKQVYDWAGYYGVVREIQPKALIAICGPDIRWVGNESGVARETEWSVQKGSPTQHPGKKYVWWPAECDVSIRPGWFYHAKQDKQVKTLEQLLDIYYKSVGRNSVLLLNVPPDRRGLIHENDAARLKELRRALDETFKVNLLTGKRATASSADGGDGAHAAGKAVDGDGRTYWTADEGAHEGWIEVDLGGAVTFNRSMIQEQIALGQRVEGYVVEAWEGGQWKEIAKGTTVGYKKLDRFGDVTASRVRFRIIRCRANPTIRELGLFRAPGLGPKR
ncbi:MAG: alpha-L-fucosidase [Phycisphaerae bacterium]|nr:alpha-L-fucosidase [Phycisphaerae bacterium]